MNRNILCLVYLIRLGDEDNLQIGSLHLAPDSIDIGPS